MFIDVNDSFIRRIISRCDSEGILRIYNRKRVNLFYEVKDGKIFFSNKRSKK